MVALSSNKSYPLSIPNIGQLERDLVLKAIDDGWISSVGPQVREFEEEFAKYILGSAGYSLDQYVAEIDSEQYIGPMDGLFKSGHTTFSYASDNPNPYKFSIDITEAPAGTNLNDPNYSFVSIFRDANGDGTTELGTYGFKDLDANKDGIQTSDTLNYTSSKLTKNDNGTYTFISTDLASQVGEDLDNYDVVLKYISEADLIAYGATAKEGEVDENDNPVPTGERTFEWGSSIVDKLGHYRTNPDGNFDARKNTRDVDYSTARGYQGELKDLEGNAITKAGWYDFTRLASENGEWQDAGSYIFGDYLNI